MSLASLIRGKGTSDRVATATPATVATPDGEKERTVASVATVAVASPPKAISTEPNIAEAWLLHFPDADPLEVHFIPAATRAEALAAYPSATAAAPLRKLADEPERSCRGCRHFRRPGLSGGYCGGDRPDLSPAYGPGHSLRRLPIDGGASCLNWEVPSNA